MVFDFRVDAPVLNLGPRAHVSDVPNRNREYLLWPALAYRVVSPVGTTDDLNFLQRAVLGLCAAGCRSPEQLSGRLHIHPQLTSLILDELRRRRLIDREGITERAAEKLILHDTLRSDAISAGWVFQDPWTAEMWPRFVTSLDYCQTEADNDGLVKLVLGSTGSPWLQRAFMQLPPREIAHAQPTPVQILRAAEAHRRALRRMREAETLSDDLGGPTETARLEKIEFIEPQPRPVFMMTYLYLPDSDTGGREWYVCEPFGFDPSARFRRSIEARFHDSQGLLRTLERLLGRSVHGNTEQYLRWKQHLREDAEVKIDLSLTVGVRSLSAYAPLVEMEMAYEEAAAQASPYTLRRAAGACRVALEAVFKDVASKYPLRGISDGLYSGRTPNRDRQFVQQCYRQAFATIGVAGEPPKSLLYVKPEQIRAAADYDEGWRLRPAILATVLLAARDPDHPLRSAIQEAPNLLQHLDTVAHLGGEGGHFGEVKFTLDDVRMSMRTVYTAVSLLMNLSYQEVGG